VSTTLLDNYEVLQNICRNEEVIIPGRKAMTPLQMNQLPYLQYIANLWNVTSLNNLLNLRQKLIFTKSGYESLGNNFVPIY